MCSINLSKWEKESSNSKNRLLLCTESANVNIGVIEIQNTSM